MDAAAGRSSVLIIEDQEALRRMYRALLTNAGYEVLEADDGEAGWRLAREERPDLVLLDIRLPKLSGYEIIERMRADEATRDIPIVVLSSAGSPGDIQKGLECGADDYAVKGLSQPKQLVSKIRAALATRRVRQSVGAYRLLVMDGGGDAARLQQDIGLTQLFRCVECQESLVLELVPDHTDPLGHWFAARFLCPKCGRVF